MRLFIAVDIPESPILARLGSDLGEIGRGIRPTRGGNQHITLKFIGEPPCSVDEIIEALDGIGPEVGIFKMIVSGHGAFPNWKRPAVLWIGFENTEPLMRLAEMIDERLHGSTGTPKERREFKAHLTVARIKGQIDIERVRRTLDSNVKDLENEGFSVPVREFILYSSTLTPEGPIYRKIKTYDLGE